MKKKNLLLFGVVAFLCMFMLKDNVSAMQCSALPNVEIDDSIPNVISLILRIIWIIVPVLLVVFGSIDLIKGLVSQKEDEIKKGQQTFIKRLIAGVLVFFVYAIVQFVISAASKSSVAEDDGVMNCSCKFMFGANSTRCKNTTIDEE